MWILLVASILPKTLLKWATLHSACATTKLKTGNFYNTTSKLVENSRKTTFLIQEKQIYTNIVSTIATAISITATATGTTTIIKQYLYCAFITLSLLLALKVQFSLSSILPSSLSSSSSSSSSSLPLPASSSSWLSLSVLLVSYLLYTISIAQFILSTVILKLTFLMNDFRIKSLYRTARKTKSTTASTGSNSSCSSSSISSSNISSTNNSNSNSSSSSSSSNNNNTNNNCNLTSSTALSSSATIYAKLFNNNYKNNHRTYNNSSKSNKVFLHYTPRDPHLRIFNYQYSFNKHFANSNSSSIFKITEDLCNYGELIGGISGAESIGGSLSDQNTLTSENINFIDSKQSSSDNKCSEINCYCDQTTHIKSDKPLFYTALKDTTVGEFEENIKALEKIFQSFSERLEIACNKATFVAGILL